MSSILCSVCENLMIQPPHSLSPSASSNNMYTDLTRNQGIEEPDPLRNIVCRTCQATDDLLQKTISGWFFWGTQDNSNQPRSNEWKSLYNTENQTNNKTAQEPFAEILRPLIPSQPSSTPPSSSSSTSITQPETPQTFAASSVSNHNIGNRKRAVPDSKEVPFNKSPLSKKTKPSAEEPVSVFQVLALVTTLEKNDFITEIRQFINEHAENGEDKKNQNLDLLRQKAQLYGHKQGMDIEDSKKTRNQDLILVMACLDGIRCCQFNKSYDKSRYYKEIRCLDLAQQKFGLELPNSDTYETEPEKNNLVSRVIYLKKSLQQRLHKIRTTLSNEEQDVDLSKKIETTVNSLKQIQKNIESQIKIWTNPASRAKIFSTSLRCLKENLQNHGIPFSLKSRQPQAQSIAELLLLLPDPTEPSRTRQYPSEYLEHFCAPHVFLFQSGNPTLDEKLREQFSKRLLQKERDLRTAAGESPEEIEVAITKMAEML